LTEIGRGSSKEGGKEAPCRSAGAEGLLTVEQRSAVRAGHAAAISAASGGHAVAVAERPAMTQVVCTEPPALKLRWRRDAADRETPSWRGGWVSMFGSRCSRVERRKKRDSNKFETRLGASWLG